MRWHFCYCHHSDASATGNTVTAVTKVTVTCMAQSYITDKMPKVTHDLILLLPL